MSCHLKVLDVHGLFLRYDIVPIPARMARKDLRLGRGPACNPLKGKRQLQGVALVRLTLKRFCYIRSSDYHCIGAVWALVIDMSVWRFTEMAEIVSIHLLYL